MCRSSPHSPGLETWDKGSRIVLEAMFRLSFVQLYISFTRLSTSLISIQVLCNLIVLYECDYYPIWMLYHFYSSCFKCFRMKERKERKKKKKKNAERVNLRRGEKNQVKSMRNHNCRVFWLFYCRSVYRTCMLSCKQNELFKEDMSGVGVTMFGKHGRWQIFLQTQREAIFRCPEPFARCHLWNSNDVQRQPQWLIRIEICRVLRHSHILGGKTLVSVWLSFLLSHPKKWIISSLKSHFHQ